MLNRRALVCVCVCVRVCMYLFISVCMSDLKSRRCCPPGARGGVANIGLVHSDYWCGPLSWVHWYPSAHGLQGLILSSEEFSSPTLIPSPTMWIQANCGVHCLGGLLAYAGVLVLPRWRLAAFGSELLRLLSSPAAPILFVFPMQGAACQHQPLVTTSHNGCGQDFDLLFPLHIPRHASCTRAW